MSWFSDRWGQGGPFGTISGALQGKQRSVNALRNFGSNWLKVGSDIAAPFTGPFAPLVAGAGNALGEALRPGSNIGDIGMSGLKGAAIGEAGHLAGAFGATAAEPELAAAGADAMSAGSGAAGAGAGIAHGAPPSLLGRVGEAVKGVGHWAADHPEPAGRFLSALGEIPRNAAETELLRQRARQTQDEMEWQRRRNQQLNPIYEALAGQARQYAGQRDAVAPNPYAGR